MATQYRLLTFKGDKGKPTPGILVDNQIVNLSKVRKAPVDTTSTLTLLEKWPSANRWLKKVAGEVAAGKHKAACKPRSRTSLLPPLMYPGNIFCIASNYVAHRKEMGNLGKMPDKKINAPVFFLKTPRQVVVGEGAKINLPRTSTAIDWESEVAVVIGKPAFWVSKKDAFKYVAGFTILNDMSIRGPKPKHRRMKPSAAIGSGAKTLTVQRRWAPGSRPKNTSRTSTISRSSFGSMVIRCRTAIQVKCGTKSRNKSHTSASI
jgi:2-keto-4-pentenoate hydratase/2-oxohepta-3-ene-1,7-dioic acid hydratase in catechol pathway